MSLAALLATGSKVWLDGVAPDEIAKNRARGITGATSNPVIVANIIERGQFDGVQPTCSVGVCRTGTLHGS